MLWLARLYGASDVDHGLMLYMDEEASLGGIAVSPDGNLAAYDSDESRTREVHVSAFPVARQPTVVSRGGGTRPFWAPDGNTLFYWTLGAATAVKSLVAARIDRGPPFTVLSTDTVLRGAYRNDASDLHPDGDRIVVAQHEAAANGGVAPGQATGRRHFIVVNWFTELRERMGGN